MADGKNGKSVVEEILPVLRVRLATFRLTSDED